MATQRDTAGFIRAASPVSLGWPGGHESISARTGDVSNISGCHAPGGWAFRCLCKEFA
ncbi:hypothetical protein ERY430_60269 [Erythrobacter sp. EC-HK427]|nr:hypothetical protein ERY430_60269 [Erythrobacter sp. EC-HK427]